MTQKRDSLEEAILSSVRSVGDIEKSDLIDGVAAATTSTKDQVILAFESLRNAGLLTHKVLVQSSNRPKPRQVGIEALRHALENCSQLQLKATLAVIQREFEKRGIVIEPSRKSRLPVFVWGILLGALAGIVSILFIDGFNS